MNKPNRRLRRWSWPLVCALLVGCAYGAVKDSTPMQESNNVIMLNFGNAVWVHVVKIGTRRLPAGQLQVAAKLLNRSPSDRNVDIRCEFRDSNGFELEKTSFAPVMLKSGVSQTWRSNSLSPDASDFRIYIRNSK